MNNKMKFLIATLFLSSTTLAFAHSLDEKVTVTGVFDFNTGARIQKGPKEGLSAHHDKIVYGSSSNVTVNAQDQHNDFTYGAKIVCLTTSYAKKSPGYNGSNLYLESLDFGRLELGSPFDVNTNMMIDLDSVAAAAKGTSWYSLLDTNTNSVYGFDLNVFNFYLAGFTSKNFGALDREPSQKINYYTPEIEGFKFGITFTPDSTNSGADSNSEVGSFSKKEIRYIDTADSNKVKAYYARYAAKNVFALAATYKAEIDEVTTLQVALTGEFGSAIQEVYIPTEHQNNSNYQFDSRVVVEDDNLKVRKIKDEYKMKDLRSFNVGAQLNRGNFGYAITYGNLLQSFTFAKALPISGDKTLVGGKETYFGGVSIGYTLDKVLTSITYIGGKNQGNSFNAIALGSEYTIAKGLVSYAEFSYVWLKGSGYEDLKVGATLTDANVAALSSQDQNISGAGILVGLKYKF